MKDNWIKQLSKTYINLTEEDKTADPRGVNPGMGDTTGPSPGGSRGESSFFNFSDKNPNYLTKGPVIRDNAENPPKPPNFKPGKGNKFTNPEWDSEFQRWIIREIDRRGNTIREYYYDPVTGEWYGR